MATSCGLTNTVAANFMVKMIETTQSGDSMGALAVPEFTTIVALDPEHLWEFEQTWPTWRAFKPEILANPMMLLLDANIPRLWWKRHLDGFYDHPNFEMAWVVDTPSWSQRERMLTAMVAVTRSLTTPFYLKIDTDCVAMGPGEWIRPWWFDHGHKPVLIAPPWSYTKPADAIYRLDNWADGVPGLAEHERLDKRLKIRYRPSSRLVKHRRIISYVMFGRTDWTAEMSRLAGERLPVPSQDTYLWYCAERRQDFYRVTKIPGWKHCHGLTRIQHVAKTVLKHYCSPAGNEQKA